MAPPDIRPDPNAPVFLARESYRRRRLIDAARFLPILGVFLFVVPSLWARDTSTVAGLVYLFVVWIGLIALAYLIARRLPAGETPETERSGDG